MDLVKEIIVETNKFRTSLLMRVMVLQVKDRTTTSLKTIKDRIREDKIKGDKVREPLLVILIHLQPPDQLSTDSCHHLKITKL